MRRRNESKELSLYKPLITFIAYEDESPTSYLMRLAEANSYNVASWLIRTENGGYKGGLLNYNKTFQLLVNYPWTGFQYLEKTKELCSLPTNNLVNNGLRYCPLCLRENRYYRMIWQLKSSFSCLKHKVWLVDNCPQCGELILSKTNLYCPCKNGHLVSKNQAITEEIPRELYLLQQYLLSGYLSKPESTYSLLANKAKITLQERIELFLFLIKWPHSVPKLEGRSYSKHYKIKELKPLLEELASILLSKGLGFWRFLYKLNQFDKTNQSVEKYKPVFVKFYRDFYNQFNTPQYRIFREIIEKFISRYWQWQITKRNIFYNEKFADNYNWIPIKQATQEYSISPTLLKKAIKEKLVISSISKKENRIFTLVHAESIKMQLHKLRNIINFTEAQQRLGLTKKQFSQIIVSNHFPEAKRPGYDFIKWQFSKESIEHYLRCLFKNKIPIQEETVTIAEAMKVVGGRVRPALPKLLESIRERSISVTIQRDNYKNIKSLRVSREQLKQWIVDNDDMKDYLTIPQVAKRLNINQEFAYQLANTGLITYQLDNNSKERLISEVFLELFTKKYIFLAEIAKATKIGSRTLITYLAEKEIYPIDHLSDKKLRLKVFSRESLKEIIILKDIV